MPNYNTNQLIAIIRSHNHVCEIGLITKEIENDSIALDYLLQNEELCLEFFKWIDNYSVIDRISSLMKCYRKIGINISRKDAKNIDTNIMDFFYLICNKSQRIKTLYKLENVSEYVYKIYMFEGLLGAEVTCACPLVDPELAEEVVRKYNFDVILDLPF